jgi:hypothetical protein
MQAEDGRRQAPTDVSGKPATTLDGAPPAEGRRILVDASNVAFTNRDQLGALGSVDNLRHMCEKLVSLGFRPIFIADARLRHEVDDPATLDQMEQRGEILQAPLGTQADYFLLALAEADHLSIVSNDSFRDRLDEFPQGVRQRVPFMIVDGEVILDFEKRRTSNLAA